jgi:hypothetical protein
MDNQRPNPDELLERLQRRIMCSDFTYKSIAFKMGNARLYLDLIKFWRRYGA